MLDNLKEGKIRIPSGCAISGIFSESGKPVNGQRIIDSIEVMHDRSNGLGGGFAGYGIYPDYADYYAFHIFYLGEDAREVKFKVEKFLEEHFYIRNFGEIPTKQIPEITDEPVIMRYFVKPLDSKLQSSQLEEKEYVVRCVMRVNTDYEQKAYIFSSGKNMGVFKANGFPEDVGRYFKLSEYEGYSWTAHGRYPTNTPGWWGGAHPFALLDYSIVHNGEISSYDANRRYIEMYGYKCTLLTDTEVITYIIDYLNRKMGLDYYDISKVISASFWQTIDNKSPEEKEKEEYLRNAFASLLITGPFSILLGFTGGMMALNDRLKLRSMVYAKKGDMAYVASEECAIRAIEPDLDWVKAPKGGEPIIFTLKK
jgi:glutamate synthase domain-containing protein 1